MTQKTDLLLTRPQGPAGHSGHSYPECCRCRSPGARPGRRAACRQSRSHCGPPPRSTPSALSRMKCRRRSSAPEPFSMPASTKKRALPVRALSSAPAQRRNSSKLRATARCRCFPGAITPGEIMALREEGYTMLKFFPAEQAGGATFLKSLASPLAGTLFCPTGGVSIANAKTYLSLPECRLRRRLLGRTGGTGQGRQVG